MKFLVSIHRPHGYDASTEGADMARAIDDLNDEMREAGARFFAGGLQRPSTALTFRALPEGGVSVTEGLCLEADQHVGGFWILDCATIEEAQEWGRKAVHACQADVEVRPLHGSS